MTTPITTSVVDCLEAYKSFRMNLAEALQRVCAYRQYDFKAIADAMDITTSELLAKINHSDIHLSELIRLCYTLDCSLTMTFSDEPINSKTKPQFESTQTNEVPRTKS